MPNQLTAEDYQMVELATKHECYSHRLWPHEVVRAIVGARLVLPAPEQNPAGRRLRGIRTRLRLSRLRSRPAPREDIAVSA